MPNVGVSCKVMESSKLYCSRGRLVQKEESALHLAQDLIRAGLKWYVEELAHLGQLRAGLHKPLREVPAPACNLSEAYPHQFISKGPTCVLVRTALSSCGSVGT